jgi:hypothetical protein
MLVHRRYLHTKLFSGNRTHEQCLQKITIIYQPENLKRPIWRPKSKWQKNNEVNLKEAERKDVD